MLSWRRCSSLRMRLIALDDQGRLGHCTDSQSMYVVHSHTDAGLIESSLRGGSFPQLDSCPNPLFHIHVPCANKAKSSLGKRTFSTFSSLDIPTWSLYAI